MRPTGKTYLVKCDYDDGVQEQGGIFVVNSVDKRSDAFWRGRIIAYGTSFTDEETEGLLPIGTKVIMDYGRKAKAKVIIGGSVCYIRDIDDIDGVIEDE